MVEHMRKTSSERMAKTNRIYASERMTLRNPAKRPEVAAKISQTKKGRVFLNRGGNGKLTKPQLMLAEALQFPMEHPIKTASVRALFPLIAYAYKADIAFIPLKLAIEIDGSSHSGKKLILDQKKTDVLNALGWTVLRFSNEEVTENLEECVKTVLSTILKLKGTTTTLPTAS
tara:strand:+ start:513 stop:1031 length:519 start_codon:yes stop_codon:yes gene_type:complete